MAFYGRDNQGYSRGGLDVESAVNLFFKGVLLFPVFLFAGYIGLLMMKHMIMHGLPVMNNATPEQQENIRERDSQIGVRDASPPVVIEPVVQESKSREEILIKAPSSPGLSVDMQERVHHQEATEAFHRDFQIYQTSYRNWVECASQEGRRCEFDGKQPSFGDYYNPSN